MSELKSRPKRIIICCDGTAMSSTTGKENVPSNVTRLARCIERVGKDGDGTIWEQVVWYDPGIGSTTSGITSTIDSAVGRGMELKVIEAYHFISLNYNEGDKIMCFGFSRGAYTARSIATLVADLGEFFGSPEWYQFTFGVEADLDQQPAHVGSDYEGPDIVYERNPHLEWSSDDVYASNIDVVGVFDTVGSLGEPLIMGKQIRLPFGPDKGGYHNVGLPPNIRNAFQALALDENRSSFSPTVWHIPVRDDTDYMTQFEKAMKAKAECDKKVRDRDVPKGERYRLRNEFQTEICKYFRLHKALLPPSNLLQVWFPGMHCDVGGGSDGTLKNEGNLEELSNTAFAWMLDQISEHVAIDRKAYLNEAREHFDRVKDLDRKASDEIARLEEERRRAGEEGWGSKVLSSVKYGANKVAHPRTPDPKPPQRREQHWGCGEIIDSSTGIYQYNGSWRRTPGHYTTNSHGMPELGDTNEYIHPSVGYRMHADPSYGPWKFNKGEFQRQETADNKGYEYIIEGSSKPITEYKLKAAPEGATFDNIPYERYAIHGEAAQAWVVELDNKYGHKEQRMGNPPDFQTPRVTPFISW